MIRATRRLRLIGLVGSGLALLLLGGFAWGWRQLESSLPTLDGTLPVAGLTQRSTLLRDDLGGLTVQAATAGDAARALGFAHAQDRFFQMDLLRRRAAGELSGLFGAATVDVDRSTRVHRFREVAAVVLDREPAHRRELLNAYAEGVNAGLASFGGRPWEYRLLRSDPEPWTPVDSVLVLYAMALDLQYSAGEYDRTLLTLRDELGTGAVRFFNPPIGPADAALDGTTSPLPEPPSSQVLDLRKTAAAASPVAAAAHEERPGQGSNAFAVAGSRTQHGSALLAGDPHLDLRIPNTWYRARLEWTARNGQPVRVTGATLPGVPGIVIGSNGRIAWSFTNSCADTGDLIALDLNQTAPEFFYHRGSDMLEFERRTDTIEVKGGDPVTVESTWTVWGPIVGQDKRGKQLVYKWTFHDPAAANFALLDLATATSVDEGISIAHRAGMPPQNILLAGANGDVAWTIAGKLPKRFGHDGRFAVSWTFGDRGWTGYLTPEEIPLWRSTPERPALWSANQRQLGADAFDLLGDGGLFEPDRGAHIRDRLDALVSDTNRRVKPADLLAIQLDAEGRWLERWRALLIRTVEQTGAAENDQRATFARVTGTGPIAATADSVAYRLVRHWHDRLRAMTLGPIFASCIAQNPEFDYGMLRTEEALWALHDQEPLHLLAPQYSSWHDLRVAAIDSVLQHLDEQGMSVEEATWGEVNTANIRHPFSRLLPLGLGDWLNLPRQPLAGDHHVPRVQRPSFGASLRIVVAPGHEDEGILHLPAGQSGHPLSPYYRAGHAAWAEGQPLPLLPGEPMHTLVLEPQVAR